MRIGLMGGTFDPIHYGHLNAAEEISELFQLQRVIFIPALYPPHKKRELTHVQHRLNMAMMAVLSNPGFDISDMEVKRGGISYTIETVKETKKRFGKTGEIFFITGSDAFCYIGEWHDAINLFKECHFIVTARPGCGVGDIQHILKETVTKRLKGPNFVLQKKGDKELQYTRLSVSESSYEVNVVTTTALDISSTSVRERISQGNSVKYLVPQEVEWYIKKEGLYGPQNK